MYHKKAFLNVLDFIILSCLKRYVKLHIIIVQNTLKIFYKISFRKNGDIRLTANKFTDSFNKQQQYLNNPPRVQIIISLLAPHNERLK